VHQTTTRPPPWLKQAAAVAKATGGPEDTSTCPTCPLEHYDAHAHHKPGLCRCTRATPTRRLCSSRRSPWPTTLEALSIAPTPPLQSPWHGETFPHLNSTPEPLRELAGEHVTGGSTPWKKERRRGRVEQRSLAPGAHEPSREGRTMDLVNHGPCLRSMDRELGSTVSRAHAHSQETKPSKSPTAPCGSATARHVSGPARPRPV